MEKLSYQYYDQRYYFERSGPVSYHLIDTAVVNNPPYGATFKNFEQPIPANKWPKYDPAVDEWSLVDNFVGVEYWNSDGDKFTIREYEKVIPEGMLTTDPGPALTLVRANLTNFILTSCQRTCVSGFKSNALGDEYFYPSDVTSQLNLNGSITDSYDPTNPSGWTTVFASLSSDGVWDKRPHTAEQIRLVGKACKQLITESLLKKDRLVALLESATTVEQAQQITWDLE